MTELSGQVLVVEDQESWREQFFGESLRDLGLTVYSASTKEAALALLDHHAFDLAVIDINLTQITGNTDGLVVVDYMKQQGVDIPIIIVSGTEDGFRVLHERSYEQIVVEIHKNAFELEEFLTQVRTVIKAAGPRK